MSERTVIHTNSKGKKYTLTFVNEGTPNFHVLSDDGSGTGPRKVSLKNSQKFSGMYKPPQSAATTQEMIRRGLARQKILDEGLTKELLKQKYPTSTRMWYDTAITKQKGIYQKEVEARNALDRAVSQYNEIANVPPDLRIKTIRNPKFTHLLKAWQTAQAARLEFDKRNKKLMNIQGNPTLESTDDRYDRLMREEESRKLGIPVLTEEQRVEESKKFLKLQREAGMGVLPLSGLKYSDEDRERAVFEGGY